MPLLKKRHSNKTLPCDVRELMSCRLREGYTVKSVNIKGSSNTNHEAMKDDVIVVLDLL